MVVDGDRVVEPFKENVRVVDGDSVVIIRVENRIVDGFVVGIVSYGSVTVLAGVVCLIMSFVVTVASFTVVLGNVLVVMTG